MLLAYHSLDVVFHAETLLEPTQHLSVPFATLCRSEVRSLDQHPDDVAQARGAIQQFALKVGAQGYVEQTLCLTELLQVQAQLITARQDICVLA